MARVGKKSRRQQVPIVLIDECGLLLLPLLRRSLAPRGRTPVLEHRARQRDKVSLIAALVISPRRHRLRLVFRAYPKAYVNNEKAAAFVADLLRGPLRGRALVVWDGGSMHKGPAIRKLLARFSRVSFRRLPAYAPQLNPVEQVWNHLKYHQLPNFAAADVEELQREATARLRASCADYARLKSYLHASDLPPPNTVLST